MDAVHFKFAGRARIGEEPAVPDAHVTIPRDALDDEESLFSVHIKGGWNPSQLGGSEHEPIVLRPLEALPDWDPLMADVLVAAQCGEEMVLPPDVELEELLRALEYYQLAPEDGGQAINLERASVPQGVRARTFLRNRKVFGEALAHVRRVLETAVAMETHFVARKASWLLHTINTKADGGVTYKDFREESYRSRAAGEALTPVDAHVQWAALQSFRDEMVASLENMGLAAEWNRKYLTHFFPHEYAAHEIEPQADNMWCLKVSAKPAEPKAKRRRTAAATQ